MATINVEVAYALPDEQTIIPVAVEEGSSVGDIIRASGILERHPEIDLERQAVGIFSRISSQDEVPVDGDRIEIYRPLVADPKAMRKKRAEAAKARKQAG